MFKINVNVERPEVLHLCEVEDEKGYYSRKNNNMIIRTGLNEPWVLLGDDGSIKVEQSLDIDQYNDLVEVDVEINVKITQGE